MTCTYKTTTQDAAAQWQLAVMAVCNNSTLNPRGADGQWTGIGDQTEVALKVLVDYACCCVCSGSVE